MKKLLLSTLLMAMYFISFAHDYPFSVVKSGNGDRNIIFIPGFASSGAVWNETVDALKNNYKCYVLTMAGFAGENPEDNPTFENWKIEIVRYIADQKIEKPIIVGHSMGGALALALAADYPNIPKKIVVVDALPCLMALSQPEFKANPDNECTEMINQISAMTEEQFTQMQKLTVARLSANESKHAEILGWSLNSDRKTFAQMYCDFSNTDLRERLQNVTAPSLILLEPFFKNMETAINEQYKNLNYSRMEYAGKGLHFVMYDDTEWYLSQLKDFIKD